MDDILGAMAVSAEPKPVVVTPTLPNGARWRRVDFHLHTPGVQSFNCPRDADLKSSSKRCDLAKKYARRLVDAKIEVAAITDYNGVRPEWFQPIREEAARSGILILPGAELSISVGKGLHILAVFPQDTDPDQINEFLRRLDRKGEPLFEGRRHREIEPNENVSELLLEVRKKFSCLLVAPHPAGDKGLVASLGAENAATLLREVGLDAIEHGGATTMHQLRSSGVLSADVLENLACVEFSDPKSLQDIGGKTLGDGQTRGTWLRLSATDIEALRLALHDPRTRLSTSAPPRANHARLLEMAVDGSGFLGTMHIGWNDDLNALVGGRGAGKSAVLETLRYALDIPPYSEPSYREGLVRHAMGSGGKVTLTVERPGSPSGRRYLVRRVLNEPPVVLDDATDQVLGIRPTEVFGPSAEPLVLLQEEIQAVSRDEGFRLRLIDVLIGEPAQQAARQVRRMQEALRANGRALLEATHRLGNQDEYEERLRSITNEIAWFESQGVADKLRAHAALTADGTTLDRARERVGDQEGQWTLDGGSMTSGLRSLEQPLLSGTSSQVRLLAEANEAVHGLVERISALVSDGAAAFQDTVVRLTAVHERWGEALRPLEEDLRRLQRELHSDQLDPGRLLELVRERSGLEPLLADLVTVEKEERRLREQRAELVRKLGDQRREEHVLRRKQCDSVNERLRGRLRLTVLFKGQKAEYRQALGSLLKGSGLTGDAIERLTAREGTDGGGLAEAVGAGDDVLQKEFGISAASAKKLVTWLAGHEERLFDIEMLMPADTVVMELIIDGEGRDLDRLSAGQRATAILLLLFALEGRVLVLDQPEDDLDGRFVYEDVVTLLREEKGLADPNRRRQLIVATHNPNIPVLGDAEQVLVLEARDSASHLLTRASIDDANVRDHLRTVLEGGEEAFRRRAQKYGGLD